MLIQEIFASLGMGWQAIRSTVIAVCWFIEAIPSDVMDFKNLNVMDFRNFLTISGNLGPFSSLVNNHDNSCQACHNQAVNTRTKSIDVLLHMR